MKVLYFHQHFSTPQGAGGTRSYEMSRCLIQKGHQVLMVCGSYQGGNSGLRGDFHKMFRRGFIESGLEVIEFNLPYSNSDGFLKRGLTFLKFALKSIKIALTEKYDLVFATTTPLTAGIPGIFAKFLRGKKFVFEVRDLWPELPRAMGVIKNPLVLFGMSVLELISYKSADRIIGLSPGIVDGVLEKGISQDKVTMVPNGCDMDLFGSQLDIWRPSEVRESDFLAVFAGTHGIANGLDAVLDAAQKLKEMGREDIKILLIGQGKMKKSLQDRAQRDGLKNVLFYNSVEKTKLPGLFAGSDLGLQILANVPAFYYGTSPNKFFDYIAAGLPVLNNYPGWLAGLIQESACGYVVPPNDSQAFAETLIKAASQKSTSSEMRKKARELASSRFDRQILGEKWVSWLEGAL